MRRMMTKKKIIELITQYGSGDIQFNIVVDVDMSVDPLNPEIEITSHNIFDELVSYIKTYNKTPKVYILYDINGESYNTPISTIRFAYATKGKNADISRMYLYGQFTEISGLPDGVDTQKVLMRIILNPSSQSASAKIRLTNNQ